MVTRASEIFTCKGRKMKRLLFVGVLLMVNTLLQADAYLLVMSKDDKLCQNITTMFNEDLFKHKEVRLKDHKEFNAMVWDKEFEFYYSGEEKPINMPRCDNEQSLGCKNAIFDINNDGKDELVAYLDERLYGTASYNEIDYAPQEENGSLKFRNSKSISVGFYKGQIRNYKEFPVQKVHNDGFKQYVSPSSFVLLRPFKVADTFYIATFFNTYGRNNWDPYRYNSKNLNDNNMVSISKYDANNEQHDLCYMMRVFPSPTFTKTKKAK